MKCFPNVNLSLEDLSQISLVQIKADRAYLKAVVKDLRVVKTLLQQSLLMPFVLLQRCGHVVLVYFRRY